MAASRLLATAVLVVLAATGVDAAGPARAPRGKPKPAEVCPEPEPCPACPKCARCKDVPAQACPEVGKASDSAKDVVETIDLEPAAPKVTVTPVETEPADKFEAKGWAKVDGRFGLWSPSGTPDAVSVPYERFMLRSQLHVRLRYEHAKRIELVASGLLTHDVISRTNLANDDVRTRYDASLREAYVGLYFPSVDLRIGQQRLAWGRSDLFAPNDVLNVTDLRDPFLAESEALHVPTLMVRADAYLGPLALQLVVSPVFQHGPYDVAGTNWAAVQPSVDQKYRGLMNLVRESFDPSLEDTLMPVLLQTQLPRNADGISVGGRALLTTETVDAALYYHYGFTNTPRVSVQPWLDDALQQVNFATTRLYDLKGLLDLISLRGPPISGTWQRRHHLGFDVGTSVGSFVLRLEGAFDSRAHFYTTELTTWSRATLQLLGSVEYQTGEVGKNLVVELWYQKIADAPLDQLIGFQGDSVAIGTVSRWTFFDHLELELRAVFGLKPLGVVARPQVAWKEGGLSVRLGAAIPVGEAGSAGAFFSRNGTVYLSTRYAF